MDKLKFSNEYGHLLYGDCLKLMKNLPDNSVDVILADLPFEVTQNKLDIKIPFEPLWKEYKRISKERTPILLFSQGLFYVDLVNSNRKMFRYDLIWDKVLTTGFLNANRMHLRVHEQIAVFYKKLPVYNPQFTEGIPLHSKGKSYKDKEHKNQNYGQFKMTDDSRAGSTKKYPKSILTFKKPHPSVAQHRTEKSIELLENLILTYSNKGDIILDNTAGSGTTGIASMNTGRKFILIDNDKYYIDLMINRLKLK